MANILKLIAGGVIILVVGIYIGGASSPTNIGGSIYNRLISFDAGIAVNGTEIIDSDGNWDGAITGSSATLSTTLAVTGETSLDSLIQGGSHTADTNTASSTTKTYTAADICDNSVLSWTADWAAGIASTTLPAESCLIADCMPNIGDTKTILFRNTAGSAGTTTEIVAGTDMTVMYPSGGNVVIAGGDGALITLIRLAASSTIAIVQEME